MDKDKVIQNIYGIAIRSLKVIILTFRYFVDQNYPRRTANYQKC